MAVQRMKRAVPKATKRAGLKGGGTLGKFKRKVAARARSNKLK